MIEIGFLLTYRTGGSLQWSSAAVGGVAALLLLPVSVYLFRESFSLPRVLGMLLTFSGLTLIARK